MATVRNVRTPWPWLGIASGAAWLIIPVLFGVQGPELVHVLLSGALIVAASIAVAAKQAMSVCCADSVRARRVPESYRKHVTGLRRWLRLL